MPCAAYRAAPRPLGQTPNRHDPVGKLTATGIASEQLQLPAAATAAQSRPRPPEPARWTRTLILLPRDGAEGPAPGTHGHPPADPPASGSRFTSARPRSPRSRNPGLHRWTPLASRRRDQQGTPFCAPFATTARAGLRAPTARSPEHHQIHAIHQHGGSPDRIGTVRELPAIRLDPLPFRRPPAADVGLTDDRRMPTLSGHRRHHAQRKRPVARQHPPRSLASYELAQFGQRFGMRSQRF